MDLAKSCSFVKFWLLYCKALFSQCIEFEIALSWWIGPCIIRKWPPLSLVMLLILKLFCVMLLYVLEARCLYILAIFHFSVFLCPPVSFGLGVKAEGYRKRAGRLRLSVAWLRHSHWPPRHFFSPNSVKPQIYTFSERKPLGDCLGWHHSHFSLNISSSLLWPILEKRTEDFLKLVSVALGIFLRAKCNLRDT